MKRPYYKSPTWLYSTLGALLLSSISLIASILSAADSRFWLRIFTFPSDWFPLFLHCHLYGLLGSCLGGAFGYWKESRTSTIAEVQLFPSFASSPFAWIGLRIGYCCIILSRIVIPDKVSNNSLFANLALPEVLLSLFLPTIGWFAGYSIDGFLERRGAVVLQKMASNIFAARLSATGFVFGLLSSALATYSANIGMVVPSIPYLTFNHGERARLLIWLAYGLAGSISLTPLGFVLDRIHSRESSSNPGTLHRK